MSGHPPWRDIKRSRAAVRRTFHVDAERDGTWWFLIVPELGTATQVRDLGQAEASVRDLIALWLQQPSDSFDVEIREPSGIVTPCGPAQ